MRAIRYSFEEALVGLARRRLVAFLSVITIAVSLAVFGLLFAVARAGQELVETLAEKSQVVLYLKPPVSPAVRDALLRTVRSAPVVAKAEFRSAEDALERFRSLFPDLHTIAEEIGTNPFQPSIEIALRAGVDAGKGLEPWAQKWREEGAVEDVQFDATLVSRVSAFVRLLRGAGFFFGGILALAAIFTITNVIRLSVYAREDEIEIMRLVGAPNAYIRGPFLAEGFVEGLIGGALATGLASLALQTVVRALRDANFGATMLPTLAASEIVAMLIIGALIGLCGAWLSLGRLKT